MTSNTNVSNTNFTSTIDIVDTSLAPDAKPVSISTTLDMNWQTIITVPQYRVPRQSFGGGEYIATGVAEIISPLLICNTSLVTATVSLRVYRYDLQRFFTILNNVPIPTNDMVPIPLNGQFLKNGDVMQVKSDQDDALDVTLSYTVGQSEEDDVQ